MFLWHWKFSILSFMAFMMLISINRNIDSMAEASQMFAFGGVMLLIWMTEAFVNVIKYLRKESA